MSVTSGLPISVQFLSDFCPIPGFYTKIPAFYTDIFLFAFCCAGNVCDWVPVDCLVSVSNDSVREMRGEGGRAGAHRWQKLLSEFTQLFLARNLLRQAEAQSWVSVLPPVLQGTG